MKLNSTYWTNKKAKVDTASEVIVEYQQEKFRKAIIRGSGGEVVGTADGTYETRGFRSRGCFVSFLTDVPGRHRPVIIGCSYQKRTPKDVAPAPGILTCSAKALEPIATKAALKSAFKPENGLKLIKIIGDGDAQDR